ncbi:MAG: polysaccharide biosynthesis/export family protein [Bdellovibrionota bacterium]
MIPGFSKRTGALAAVLLAAVLAFLRAPQALAGAPPYLVGPGDVLRIDVWREEELSGSFVVGSKGQIQYPLLGEIPVAGKTAAQIKEELGQTLGKDYLIDPVVTVSVSEFRSHKVFLFGHVAKPGLYYLREDPSFLKVLLEAGGPASPGVASASVLRFSDPAEKPESAGGSPLKHVRVDLGALFARGDLSQDILLESSDIVFLNRPGGESDLLASGTQIFVLGEVNKPGTYTWREGYTALNAVLDAGGLTEFAAANRARLVRGTGEGREIVTIRLGDLVEGEIDKNVTLQPGDLISIPESLF